MIVPRGENITWNSKKNVAGCYQGVNNEFFVADGSKQSKKETITHEKKGLDCQAG